jgi:hypothetical protein
VILGGQDGLVNTLGLVLGVAAASSDRIIILAAGLSATIAECISMGGVAYTSKLAEKDFYKSEYAREQRHIEKVPMIEQYEIRELFRRKGFEVSTFKIQFSNKSIFMERKKEIEILNFGFIFAMFLGRTAQSNCGNCHQR